MSRCKSSATFYLIASNGAPQTITLSELLKDVKARAEKMVYMDKECQVAVRLILEPVPEEVAQKRRAKASQKTKSNGYKVSGRTLDACGFTVLVTNAPENMLPAHIVIEVYFLRWQIEIIFKTWKSLLCIDKLKPMSIFRFECYLYCKLIHVVICMLLGNLAQARLGMTEEISIWKATKLYVKKIGKIEKALGKGLKALEAFLNNLVLKITKKCLKAAKKIGQRLYKRRPKEVIKCISSP